MTNNHDDKISEIYRMVLDDVETMKTANLDYTKAEQAILRSMLRSLRESALSDGVPAQVVDMAEAAYRLYETDVMEGSRAFYAVIYAAGHSARKVVVFMSTQSPTGRNRHDRRRL